MAERKLATFFYGSFMDSDVLRQIGLDVDSEQPAGVAGFDIELRPRVNLIPAWGSVVFGSVIYISQPGLRELYDMDAMTLKKRGVIVPQSEPVVYRPEAVLAQLARGGCVAALCYVAERRGSQPPDPEYVDSVVKAAAKIGLPLPYINHLRTFRANAS